MVPESVSMYIDAILSEEPGLVVALGRVFDNVLVDPGPTLGDATAPLVKHEVKVGRRDVVLFDKSQGVLGKRTVGLVEGHCSIAHRSSLHPTDHTRKGVSYAET